VTAWVAVLLGTLLTCMLVWPAMSMAVTFDPELIITNDNMRDRDCMSAAEIQAFLDTQTGPLKSLVTTDYTGVEKPASQIIWEACQAWSISPKVMLTMLQKEQSLLTRTSLAPRTLSRAIGAGCPNGTTNKFPGFGKQMWYGTKLLDGYGEPQDAPRIPLYYPGIVRWDIYRHPHVKLYPRNLATYKLFVYNPSIGARAPYGDLSSQAGRCTGNANFWLIYRRYFGDPLGHARMRPVYEFVSRKNGTYLYTASIAERHKLVSRGYTKSWSYRGTKFSCDASVSAAATVPMHRFYNKLTRRYSFTTSEEKYESRTGRLGALLWRYQGVAFRVAKTTSPGAVTVHRFKNRKTGGYRLTASARVYQTLSTDSSSRRTWHYEGVAFYLPREP
jgi:hypothetical protein